MQEIPLLPRSLRRPSVFGRNEGKWNEGPSVGQEEKELFAGELKFLVGANIKKKKKKEYLTWAKP